MTHLQLTRFSPSDVSTFLTAVFDQDPSFRAVDALHTRTGGNPFFLEELVASASDLGGDGLEDAPLPWTVADVVHNQIEGLDPDVRTVVAAASVLGRRVSFDLLAAVTGASEADLIDHLRLAVDSGLLVETDADVFGFHHDLAREAIEAGLLGRERRRLHEAAIDALRRSGSRDHAALAHHARGAARFDEMVEEARLGAHQSLGLGSTYQALQLAETGLAEADDDLDLRSVAAEAASLAGLLDEASEHGDRWLAEARRQGDTSHEAKALSLRMRVAFDLGDLAACAGFTEELIGMLDQLPDEERAMAMASVAQSYMLRDLVEPTREWADKALALAEANDFETVRLTAMVEKGSVLVIEPATADEGVALLQEAADEAERTGDHVLAARSLVNLVWHARHDEPVRRGAAARPAHAPARGDGRVRLAGQLRDASRPWRRWRRPTATSTLPSTCSTAAPAPTPPMRFPATAGGWRCCGPGSPSRPTTWRRPPRSQRRRSPSPPAAWSGSWGWTPTWPPARETCPGPGRGRRAARGHRRGGLCAAVQVHDIMAPSLRAGLDPAELRPFVEAAGIFPGNRLPADHHTRQLLDAQLAEAEGRPEAAAALYAASASSDETSGMPARHAARPRSAPPAA